MTTHTETGNPDRKEEDLKPCPFCGGEPVDNEYSVYCSGCYAEILVRGEGDGEAQKRWNTRPTKVIGMVDMNTLNPQEDKDFWDADALTNEPNEPKDKDDGNK